MHHICVTKNSLSIPISVGKNEWNHIFAYFFYFILLLQAFKMIFKHGYLVSQMIHFSTPFSHDIDACSKPNVFDIVQG